MIDTVQAVQRQSAIGRFGSRMKSRGTGLLGIVAFIVLWELYCRTLGRSFDTIASTTEIVGALRDLLIDGPLLEQLAHTIRVTLLGWIMAAGIGGACGLVLGLWRPAHNFAMASVEILRAIPSIAFIPIALMIFGFSVSMELAIVVYVSQWPVLMGVLGGVKTVHAQIEDVGRTFRLTRRATVLKIVIPSAMPSIMVGLRLSLTLCVAMAVVAEMLGNPSGLGFGMVFSQQAFQPAEVFAYLVVIGLLGWLLNVLFVRIASRLMPGHAGAL